MELPAGVFVADTSTEAWEPDPEVPGSEMRELVRADGVWAGLTRFTRVDGPVPWTPERREIVVILEGSVRIQDRRQAAESAAPCAPCGRPHHSLRGPVRAVATSAQTLRLPPPDLLEDARLA